MKILFMGQAASRASDPEDPLAGKGGAFLSGLLGVALNRFMNSFDRMNVLSAWPGKNEKGKCGRFKEKLTPSDVKRVLSKINNRNIIFLGKEVASALGVRAGFFESGLTVVNRACFRYLVIPHPTGVNLIWSDPDVKLRAKEEIRAFVLRNDPENKAVKK